MVEMFGAVTSSNLSTMSSHRRSNREWNRQHTCTSIYKYSI